MVGQTVSHYKVLEKLGEGGMGEVYLAEDISLERKVALKFLPDLLREDEIAHKRFIREAKAAAALDHPFICKIYETGQTDDGQDFISMEYVEGQTLKEKLFEGPLSIRDVVRLSSEVSEALEKAHSQGIVHRDIKTANIMMTSEDHVKVLDFGLAKHLVTEEGTKTDNSSTLTGEGLTLGTLPYMSPEQVRGEVVDTRTDIFSFGTVLYETLTGVHPFRKEKQVETADAILHGNPPPLTRYIEDLPELLQHTVRKMLAKDPDDRYQSIHEVRSNLSQLAEDSGKRERCIPLRWPWKIAMATAVILVVALGGIWLSYHSLSPSPQAIVSLAVLPFETRGNHPHLEILGQAIPESLISKLSPLFDKVIARSSSFRFDPSSDVQKVGKELNVQALVTGTLMIADEFFSISVELVDTSDSHQLWGKQYRKQTLEEVIANPEVVAKDIAKTLQLQLTDQETAQLAKGSGANPDAYMAYLEGRRILLTYDHLEKAAGNFLEAIAADPRYAPAYAGLARIQNLNVAMGWTPLRELLPSMRETTNKALEVDDSLAETRAVLGFQKVLERDWLAAETEFRRAIELDPQHPDGYVLLATSCLAPMGRLHEAIVEMKKALEVDPISVETNFRMGWCYYLARRYDEAIRYLRLALEKNPDHWLSHWYLGCTYLQKKMIEEARAEFTLVSPKTCPVCPPGGGLGHPYVLASLGEKNQALRALEDTPTGKAYREMAYTALGEVDQALEWLGRNIEEELTGGRFSMFRLHLMVDPLWDPLREDPRFQGILRRMNFPE